MNKIQKSVILSGGAVTAAAATAIWAGFTAIPGGAYWAKPAASGASVLSEIPVAAVPVSATPAMKEAASMQTAFNQVARQAGPAVVTITTMQRIPAQRSPFGGFGGRNRGGGGGNDPFGGLLGPQFGIPGMGSDDGSDMEENGYSAPAPAAPSAGREVKAGLGSGFVFREDGMILTNAHVVRGASRVTVKIGDVTYKDAKVVGIDERTDIAVVKVPATGLTTVALGDSDQVNVGDWSIAVGNPLGYEHTVTVGVISAKGREIRDSRNPIMGSSNLLQTDASINPGNSGGPLLDIYGRVVGINEQIATENGGSVGLGFAIPIDTAKHVADALIKDGHVRRAYIGVNPEDVSAESSAYGFDASTKGVIIAGVGPNTPASTAGLQAGDLVTSINGHAVSKATEFVDQISGSPVGSTVTLDVLRNGKHLSVSAKLAELPDRTAARTPKSGPNGNEGSAPGANSLGVRTLPLTPQIASQLGLDENTHGVVVASVQRGSLAAEAGLNRGDVIERVGQTPIVNATELNATVAAILSRESADNKSVALLINRGGQEQYIIVGQPADE